jgi:hypothetical protein
MAWFPNWLLLIVAIIAIIVIFTSKNPTWLAVAYLALGIVFIWWGIENIVTASKLFRFPGNFTNQY